MILHKYQALGNDYLVWHAGDRTCLTPERVRRICHRHFGVGSDGILLPQPGEGEADFGLQIYNPDGSEAEKSGNGLRIFARYLWDQGRVGEGPFTIRTPGGTVRAQVGTGAARIRVEMGPASFQSADIPVRGERREVVDEPIVVGGREFRFTAVTVGNPHCVVPVETVNRELALRYGPDLEVHPLFPNRTNVQFVRPLDRHVLQVEIWERGAGYTLASGSSSCAAAAACVRLGLCDDPLTVRMPGGTLEITVDSRWDLTMTGPAEKVAEVTLAAALLQ